MVFINEIHMLDIECFTFLNAWIKISTLATNRGICTIREADMISPHGIPVDFLDKL